MRQGGFVFGNPRFTQRHHGFGMGDARRRAQKDRRVELFAEGEGELDILLRFLGIGRLQHGNFGELGVVAVVLLVLRAVHGRIIGADDDQSPRDSGVADGKNRIGGHVHADVLHHRQRPGAAQSRADGHFHRDFFIGRPFGVNAVVPGELLHDFGAGRARVGRRKPHARLIHAAGDGFISRHQYFFQMLRLR